MEVVVVVVEVAGLLVVEVVEVVEVVVGGWYYTCQGPSQQHLGWAYGAVLLAEVGLEVGVAGEVDGREGDVSQEAGLGALRRGERGGFRDPGKRDEMEEDVFEPFELVWDVRRFNECRRKKERNSQ